jgi:hypothetical protein
MPHARLTTSDDMPRSAGPASCTLITPSTACRTKKEHYRALGSWVNRLVMTRQRLPG